MPVPSTIDQLNTTAASNYPQGSDSPSNLDDVQRAHGSFIAKIRDLVGLGTGTYVQATATANMNLAGAGANSDITSLSALTTINSGPIDSAKDPIVNGDMRIAQMGNVAVSGNTGVYGGADRTALLLSGFTTIAGTLGQSSMGGTSSGFGQFLTSITSTGTGSLTFIYRIPYKDTLRYNSKTITLSAKLYQDSGSALNASIAVYKANAADNFSTSTLLQTSSNTSIPNAATTQISATFTLGASDASNGLEVRFQYVGNVGALTSKSFGISDIHLDTGIVVTAMPQRHATLERMLCQERYETGGFVTQGAGYASSYPTVFYKVPKNKAPTITNSRGVTTVHILGADGSYVGFYQNSADSAATLATWTASDFL